MRGTILWASLHSLLLPACCLVFVHASVLAGRRRWPDGGINNRLQWVRSGAVYRPVTFLTKRKMVHMGSALARQSRGGVTLSDGEEKEVVFVFVCVGAICQ